MNVTALIAELQKLPADAPVYATFEGEDGRMCFNAIHHVTVDSDGDVILGLKDQQSRRPNIAPYVSPGRPYPLAAQA